MSETAREQRDTLRFGVTKGAGADPNVAKVTMPVGLALALLADADALASAERERDAAVKALCEIEISSHKPTEFDPEQLSDSLMEVHAILAAWKAGRYE